MMQASGTRPDSLAGQEGSWTSGLPAWYAAHGRHHLPWRGTLDPWAVLVSEVMLQQTSVARVLPRWEAFMRRWPRAAGCAAAGLGDVLREWSGLGYPRRARALWQTAAEVAAHGWPEDEAGLRRLPGVGPYTARALLWFAWGVAGAPPRDVNLGRVAARAGLGAEAHEVTAARLDAELLVARPPGMSPRDYAFALFDLGATVCLARRPRCGECPVAAGCAARERLQAGSPPPSPRRQPAYAGSLRRLRGAILGEMLSTDPPRDQRELDQRVSGIPAAARPGAVAEALEGLRRDGLLPDDPPARDGDTPR
jgi:A/G-specific adenine glycosylase